MLTVDAIDHLVFNVRDVEISALWYARVLGMRREDRQLPSGAVRTSMMFGANKINLRPIDATQEDWFTARSPSAGSDDLCFLTETRPDAVAAHFRQCEVEIVLAPSSRAAPAARSARCTFATPTAISSKSRPTADTRRRCRCRCRCLTRTVGGAGPRGSS